MAFLGICPICRQKELRKHCESKTCNWYKCHGTVCDYTISKKTGKAYKIEGASVTYQQVDTKGIG